MAVLLLGVVALIGFRVWMRLEDRPHSAIEDLAERIAAIEQAETLTETPRAREPDRQARECRDRRPGTSTFPLAA